MADNFNILDRNLSLPGGVLSKVAQITNDRVFLYPGSSVGTTNTLGNGTLRVSPIVVPNQLLITHFGADVTVAGDAGCTIRLALYADGILSAGGRQYPINLLAEPSTQIAGDSVSVQEVALASTLVLPPGVYWLGGVVQGVTVTQPTLRTLTTGPGGLAGGSAPSGGGSQLGYSQGGVTGALPTPFGSFAGSIGSAPRVHLRLA